MVKKLEESKKMLKSPIISCSRRTDIPAFLMGWLLEQIEIGYVDVVNPFNRSQISRVSLIPKDVKCWVFWSKNFSNWIECYKLNRELFQSYKGFYFQFTINSPSELEKNVKISLEERFTQLKWLIEEFGLLSVNFRFDPIVIFKNEISKKVLSNLSKFEYIIKNISSLGLKEMTFSFATIYSKVQKRMVTRGNVPIDISTKKKIEITHNLLDICNNYNIKMKTCCQPDLLKIDGIEQAHCVDANKIEKIIKEQVLKRRDTGQRKECGCYKSKDIGGYTGIFRCKHNCDYCYASPAKE